MSANSWMVCPRCKLANEFDFTKKKEAVSRAYGKVPADKYLAMTKELSVPQTLQETFREDWELGVLEDGSFYVRYSGACTECKLTYKFSYDLKEIPDLRTPNNVLPLHKNKRKE